MTDLHQRSSEGHDGLPKGHQDLGQKFFTSSMPPQIPHGLRPQPIKALNLDFASMGIGGLTDDFVESLRKTLLSRLTPPEYIQALKVSHYKTILLHGELGVGKTLLIQNFGHILPLQKLEMINGALMDSEEVHRRIYQFFEQAQREQKQLGHSSGLFVLVLDRIDEIPLIEDDDDQVAWIGSQMNSNLSVLHNVLVIGVTNSLGAVHEHLLQRFERHLEITLPNEQGRMDILRLHTEKLRQYNLISPDVDMVRIVQRTVGFSGSQLECLARNAQLRAQSRLARAPTKSDSPVELDFEGTYLVTDEDFMESLDLM